MGRPLGSRNKYSGRDRFPTCYEADPQTGCWNWTKSRGSHGYGDFRRDGHKLAHRWAYATFVGPIPEDAWVLHRCDNKACVNPEHLFLGTADDNNKDMVAKGRHYSKGKTFEDVYGAEEAAKKRARLREWALENPTPPEARQKVAAKNRGKKRTLEQRLRMGAAIAAAFAKNPKRPPTPDERAAHSIRMKEWWADRKGLI
ncbi:MAG TPA: HNH endonuclease signature motif containing protein [Vineibacter sp.]|nr:HNH endonuclease signature motif containing protein [Vineibacter sp.]